MDRLTVLGLLVAVTSGLIASPDAVAREPWPRRLLTDFDRVRASLATDEIAVARKRARTLSRALPTTLKKVGITHPLRHLGKVMLGCVRRELARAGKARKPSKVRYHFGYANACLVTLLANLDELRSGLRLMRCEKNPGFKTWIQGAGPADNPYPGSAGRRCGVQSPEWDPEDPETVRPPG